MARSYRSGWHDARTFADTSEGLAHRDEAGRLTLDTTRRSAATDRPQNVPRGKGVLETFAHHPDLARAFFTFNRHVLWETSLRPRWRHILIMRIAARRSCRFLYTQHFFQAIDAGLSRDEIKLLGRTTQLAAARPAGGSLEPGGRRLVDRRPSQRETWEASRQPVLNASEQQILDVIFTIGCYLTVAGFMDSVGLEVDRSYRSRRGPAMTRMSRR